MEDNLEEVVIRTVLHDADKHNYNKRNYDMKALCNSLKEHERSMSGMLEKDITIDMVTIMMERLEKAIREFETIHLCKPPIRMSTATNTFLSKKWTKWGKNRDDNGATDDVFIISIYGCNTVKDESLDFGVIKLGGAPSIGYGVLGEDDE